MALKFTISLFISGELQEVEGEAVAVDGEPEQPPNLGGDPSPARTTAKMMNQRTRKRRDVNIEICIFMRMCLINSYSSSLKTATFFVLFSVYPTSEVDSDPHSFESVDPEPES